MGEVRVGGLEHFQTQGSMDAKALGGEPQGMR